MENIVTLRRLIRFWIEAKKYIRKKLEKSVQYEDNFVIGETMYLGNARVEGTTLYLSDAEVIGEGENQTIKIK